MENEIPKLNTSLPIYTQYLSPFLLGREWLDWTAKSGQVTQKCSDNNEHNTEDEATNGRVFEAIVTIVLSITVFIGCIDYTALCEEMHD
jgi:hypothetical protein